MENKKEKKPINLLALIPIRSIQWEKKGDGLIDLLKPKFKHRLVKKIIPHQKKPYFKIKLDEIGSFIWGLCDGCATVKELGEILKEKFGDQVEPVYDRLALFLQNLEKHQFISYKNHS